MEDTTTQELIKSILSDTLLEEQPVQEAVRTGLMSGLPGTRTVANAQQEDNESLSKKARQVVQDFIVQLSRSADDSPTSSYVEKEANEITDVMVDSETLLNRFNTPRYAFIRNLQDYDPEKSVIKIRNRGDYSNDFLTQMEELAKKSAEEAVSLRESKGITQSLVRPPKNRFEVDILIDRMLRGKETDEQESTTLADTDIDPDTDNADGGAASSDGKGLMSPRLDSKGETPEKSRTVDDVTFSPIEEAIKEKTSQFYDDIGTYGETDHGDTPVQSNDEGAAADDLDVGYGHKLKQSEKDSGMIHGIKFKNADGTYIPLTDAQKREILKKDFEVETNLARTVKNGWDSKLAKKGSSWDQLNFKYQNALSSLAFNTGGVLAGTEWNKVLDAAIAEDPKAFAKEMRRTRDVKQPDGTIKKVKDEAMDNRVAKELYYSGIIDKLSEVSDELPNASVRSGIPQ